MHRHKARRSVCDGHKGELGMCGKGISKVRCRYWIVLDQSTVSVTPSEEKVASLRHRCNLGLKDSRFVTNRLDFRKKEKKATKHEAQKVTSIGEEKSTSVNILRRISGVIGSFCFCDTPNTLFAP